MTSNTNEATASRPIPWKWIFAGLVVAALLTATQILPVREWLTALNLWLEELGLIGILAFILIYILATVLFLPGLILTIGAGFAFGLAWGFAGVSIGSTTGAACAFLIGRYFARDKVREMAADKPKFKSIDRAVGEKGWKIVLLLRLSPLVPFNLQNYVYGLTAIRFWPYVAASWVGMMPGTLLYVYLGTAGREVVEAAARGEMERDPLQTTFFAVGLVVTLIVTIYITRIAKRALAEAQPDVLAEE